MIENSETTQFLEAVLRTLLGGEVQTRKIVLAYIDNDFKVGISYLNCNYAELQQVGQELINEGMIRLIALEDERIQKIRDEKNEDDAT